MPGGEPTMPIPNEIEKRKLSKKEKVEVLQERGKDINSYLRGIKSGEYSGDETVIADLKKDLSNCENELKKLTGDEEGLTE